MERKKILLVDDVELFLMLEKSFLNRDEFEVLTARSGSEALELVHERVPDLILMDLYMPGMNGDECCQILKGNATYQHIPIIMVTSANNNEDYSKCRLAGCDHIINKPINRHDFLTVIRNSIDIRVRAALRHNVSLRVNYCETSGPAQNGDSANISITGIYLVTDLIPPIDTPLVLAFSLPENNESIRCKGRVVWTNDPMKGSGSLPSGCGVQFLDLTPGHKDAISNYIYARANDI